MPIEKIPASQSLDIRRANHRAIWPTPGKGSEELYPIALPQFSPPFTMKASDRVFCIGSCFARELEAVLFRHGFSVLSRLQGAEKQQDNAGILNRYSVPAIREEVRRALSSDVAERKEKDISEKVFARLRDADVVVLTLGLSEAWFDGKEKIYLNTMPSPRSIRRDPKRYELHLLSVAETVRMLKESIEMLREHLPSGLRIILTVSPIPLHSTFRDMDVITANASSKATLRSAVEEIIPLGMDIAYFPSYEIATTSEPRAVWGQADYRHVDRDFVAVIIAHALASLIPEEAAQFESIREEARRSIEAKLRPVARPLSLLQRLERSAVEKTLSKRKQRKYQRGRDAFFEDSPISWIRGYGRITQKR